MAGSKTGAQKARETNLKNNPNYYSDIGKKSWNDPKRSRNVGFAAHPELAKTAGAKGGRKTKNDHEKALQQEAATEEV